MQLYELLLVLNPSPHISVHIRDEKEWFKSNYGYFESYYSTPHITLSNLLILPDKTSTFLNSLREKLLTVEPFDVNLAGYGSFETGKTIHVNVIKDKFYEKLLMQLALQKAEFFNRRHFNIINEPHLTIAKNLSPFILMRARNEYYKRDFFDCFEAKSITVLSRSYNEVKTKWSFLEELSLKN